MPFSRACGFDGIGACRLPSGLAVPERENENEGEGGRRKGRGNMSQGRNERVQCLLYKTRTGHTAPSPHTLGTLNRRVESAWRGAVCVIVNVSARGRGFSVFASGRPVG